MAATDEDSATPSSDDKEAAVPGQDHEFDPRDELRHLAKIVQTLAKSAELAADREDSERSASELKRMRRMLLAWENLRDQSVLDVRMHFTTGIDFFAEVTRRADEIVAAEIDNAPAEQRIEREERVAAERRASLRERAALVVRKIEGLDPAAARTIDAAHLARAIDHRARGRWNWAAVAKAWGRDHGAEVWRTEWFRWQQNQP